MPAASLVRVSEPGAISASKRVAVAGATGTIGQAVVRALVADGHVVTPLVRANGKWTEAIAGEGALAADYANPESLAAILHAQRIETVISCIASRSGAPKDAEAVDYRANRNLLTAAEQAGAGHFVLLSAICVQRPKLAFQRAKLAFEAELVAAAIDHTIVRPTAFFKSLSGQVERVRAGKPFLLFGNGALTRCKPISDRDLARFIAECLTLPDRRGAVLPIGGPGPAITLREQGALLFKVAGREPKYRSVPVGLFSAAVAVLSLGERFSGWFAEKAEYARIARYYATESMLVLDPATGTYSAEATPEFGEDTLLAHYHALLAQDPA